MAGVLQPSYSPFTKTKNRLRDLYFREGDFGKDEDDFKRAIELVRREYRLPEIAVTK